MSGKNFDVFISYRHSDGTDKAISLEANFERAGCRTFRDDNDIGIGEFDKEIEKALLDAPVFVMVLTSDYFQRCNQEGDWVRREIDLAIENENEKAIIPINYNGVLKGVPDYLDEEFRKKVGRYNFLALHTDTSFSATLNYIIERYIKPKISSDTKNKAKLSVKTDANCKLIEDDEIIATLQKGKTKQIFVERGEHEFIARSTEYNDIEQSIRKDVKDINSKYILKIELAEQIEKRIKEIEEKEKEKERIRKNIEEFLKKQVSVLKTLEGHSSYVESVAYSPDGTKIISGGFDDTIKIWDANTGECLKTLEGHLSFVLSVAYSPDSTKIISGSVDKTIKIWNANTGQGLQTLKGHSECVLSVAYSPDGTKIVSGSDDKTIKIWDANTGECLQTLMGHSECVLSVAYSPDGTKIVSGSDDKTIKIWDANTGECLQTLEGYSLSVLSVAYSPDGTKIISGSKDETIKIWNANTGQCLQTLKGHSDNVESVAYSPDGSKIISGSGDKTIKIWDANTGKCLKTLEGHLSFVLSVAYSPDGTKIISGSFDKTIKIWGEE